MPEAGQEDRFSMDSDVVALWEVEKVWSHQIGLGVLAIESSLRSAFTPVHIIKHLNPRSIYWFL